MRYFLFISLLSEISVFSLCSKEAEYKVKTIVHKLVWPLRAGLLCDIPEVFENSLMALK